MAEPGVRVFFMCPPAVLDQVKAAAAREDMPVAQWLRRAIREKLDRDAAVNL